MIHQSTRRRVWDKLLESLGGAEAGGRELDIVIHYLLGSQAEDAGGEASQMIELLVEEGYPWEVVSELLDAELPPYTTTLDAALPGENIVLALHSPRRGRWAAVHQTPGGQHVLVWAASECLARRRAALKGLGAKLPARAKPAAPQPAPSAHGWSRMPEAATTEAATQDSGTQDAEAPEESETEWKILF